MSNTVATLFGGGGGFDIGAMAAGLIHLWSVEYDERIAAVANDNGLTSLAISILDTVPGFMPIPDWLHMSPPCPNFSQAKANAVETDNDIALANKCAEFIRVMQPRIVSLENVYLYRKSQSFKIICDELTANGYTFKYWRLCAADYGVPQKRYRLILIARRDGKPVVKPWPTHSKTGDMFTKKWNGWYDAIEDLLPGLEDSQFAPWQLERLPDEIRETFIISEAASGPHRRRNVSEPVDTVTATVSKGGGIKALLMMVGNTSKNGTSKATPQSEPANTVTITGGGIGRARAFIAGGKIQHGKMRLNHQGEPSDTVLTDMFDGRISKIFSGSRVVKMSPLCLARFQSFPDNYKWPDSKSLACRINGNAVPPLMAQRIVEEVMNV